MTAKINNRALAAGIIVLMTTPLVSGQTNPDKFVPSGHYYFATAVPNTMLAVRRHELWLSGAAHDEGSRHNRSVSIFYAPLPAIHVYASSFDSKHRQEFGQPFNRFQSWEVGLGSGTAVTPFLFAGLKAVAGTSQLTPMLSSTGAKNQLKYRHWGLQGELAFMTNFFDMGAGWRQYWAHYTAAEIHLPADSQIESNFRYLESNNTVRGGDWLFFARAGWPFLKLEASMRAPGYLKPAITRDKNTFTLSLMFNPVGLGYYWRDHFGKNRLFKKR